MKLPCSYILLTDATVQQQRFSTFLLSWSHGTCLNSPPEFEASLRIERKGGLNSLCWPEGAGKGQCALRSEIGSDWSGITQPPATSKKQQPENRNSNKFCNTCRNAT